MAGNHKSTRPRYLRRKEAGLCTYCGRSRADADSTMCFSCLTAYRNRKRKLLDTIQYIPAKDKPCAKCGSVKTPAEFKKSRERYDGLATVCLACANELAACWRDKNREKLRMSVLSNQLNKFGVSIDWLTVKLAEQGNACAICLEPFSTGIGTSRHSRAIDHCHQTGNIRGLLCMGCNAAIGMALDSPEILRRAADYIESYKKDSPVFILDAGKERKTTATRLSN